jgi:signal transduction histidine kinase
LAESFIAETKRYIGLTTDDEATLAKLGPRLEKYFPELANRFYAQIPHHPNASKVLSGPAQIGRLKLTLQNWARGLFNGLYDDAYAAERFLIGYRHVRIGLEQRYVISAMGIVRAFLHDCLREEIIDTAELRSSTRAINRILDLDLNLMCESYMQATLENLQRLNSELEMANRSLEVVSHTKDVFLSHVSHELRTPLNSILGFTKLILDGVCSTPEEERELLRDVFSSARHLLDLVNDILDIRRIEEGKLSLRIENVNLRNLIDSTLPLIAVLANEKRLDLRDESIGHELPLVWADEMRVRQILLNLLNNAVKFTSAGSITVRVISISGESVDPSMVRLEVEDTGAGIPEEMREKVFGEFIQLGDLNLQKMRGAGLGLAISRRLVGLMGGEIGIEAAKGDHGTLAWFTVPQAHSTAGPISSPDSESSI